MNELKKYYLTLVLDAYVTKNAIEEFLNTDWSDFRLQQIQRGKNPIRVDFEMAEYKSELREELNNIEIFLNEKEEIHWVVLGYTREFFDSNLPKHKRKIKWFHDIARYPFDHSVFYNKISD